MAKLSWIILLAQYNKSPYKGDTEGSESGGDVLMEAEVGVIVEPQAEACKPLEAGKGRETSALSASQGTPPC